MTTNALLTPSIITKETLVILENNLVMAGKVNRQFENQFHKIGTTLTIRKPNRFLVTNGPGLSLQNITEPSTSITISNQQHVDFQFSSADLTLTVEEFSERYCKPGAVKLANQIDFGVYTNYTSFSNLVGTYGSVPSTFASLAAVGQRMDELAAPQDDRTLVLTPAAYWSHRQRDEQPLRHQGLGTGPEGLPRQPRQLHDLHGSERASVPHLRDTGRHTRGQRREPDRRRDCHERLDGIERHPQGGRCDPDCRGPSR